MGRGENDQDGTGLTARAEGEEEGTLDSGSFACEKDGEPHHYLLASS